MVVLTSRTGADMKAGTTDEAGTKKTTRKKAGGAVRKKARKPSRKKLVQQAIQSIGDRVGRDEVKGTVGDLIRLLQLEKELDEDAPKKVEVKWVNDKSGD